MKSENPYRDIFTTLQGFSFGEATEILEAVLRSIQDISASQTLTPEIVGGLDLEPPRKAKQTSMHAFTSSRAMLRPGEKPHEYTQEELDSPHRAYRKDATTIVPREE